MCILEKLSFKISRGHICPAPPSVLALLALDSILAGPNLNCFRRACLLNILYSFINSSYCKYLHTCFFYKNKVYKNTQSEVCPKFKNKLRTIAKLKFLSENFKKFI